MFKKTLLAFLLFSIILVSSDAEEAENVHEVEEVSSIIQCDEQFNECAEECGESSPNKCIEQCQLTAKQCYNNVLCETDNVSDTTESDIE